MSEQVYIAVGLTGVGKSSFINALFGEYIVEESKFRPGTKMPRYVARGTPYGDISIIDTPGLGEQEEKDAAYLRDIKEEAGKYNNIRIIYVCRLDNTRLRASEMNTLDVLYRMFVDLFGHRIWDTAIFVLTHCANLPAGELDGHVSERVRGANAFLHRQYRFGGFSRVLMIDNKTSAWLEGRRSMPVALAIRD